MLAHAAGLMAEEVTTLRVLTSAGGSTTLMLRGPHTRSSARLEPAMLTGSTTVLRRSSGGGSNNTADGKRELVERE